MTTHTDAGGGHEWRVSGDVDRLRFWGSSAVRPLPFDAAEPLMIGSGPENWLQLVEPKVSRQHAKLQRLDHRWTISDLGSKNGLRQDGALRLSFPLVPGVEIGIGGVALIAENAGLIALRELLSRLIGWSEPQQANVDLALRAVRMAATRRESLLLCGDGDLMAIAKMLHVHALGDDRPFVVCDPRRRRGESTARAAANYDSGLVALEAAAGGTLCIWRDRQPDDFDRVLAAIREPTSRVQLVVCARELVRGEMLITTPILIPPLAERAPELDRVIDAYGKDTAAEFGTEFLPIEHAWIREHEATTHADIQKSARRLIGLRATGGSVTKAAALLGMAHGSYSEWLARRPLPKY